jgi:hypothetical protein
VTSKLIKTLARTILGIAALCGLLVIVTLAFSSLSKWFKSRSDTQGILKDFVNSDAIQWIGPKLWATIAVGAFIIGSMMIVYDRLKERAKWRAKGKKLMNK